MAVGKLAAVVLLLAATAANAKPADTNRFEFNFMANNFINLLFYIKVAWRSSKYVNFIV